MPIVRLLVRRSLGGYASLFVLSIFAAASGLGLVAMLVQGEAIAWVPGTLFTFAAFGLLAIGVRRISIVDNELCIRSITGTRRFSIAAIVDAKAPPPQWIGWLIFLRFGYFSLEIDHESTPIVFYTYFQRQDDLEALRARLLAAAEHSTAHHPHPAATTSVSPKPLNVALMASMGFAALIGGAAMAMGDFGRAVVLLLCGIFLLSLTWVDFACGKAFMHEDEIRWRTISGRIEAARFDSIISVEVDQGWFILADGRRVRIRHGLATRGATERFLEELQRRTGRTTARAGYGA